MQGQLMESSPEQTEKLFIQTLFNSQHLVYLGKPFHSAFINGTFGEKFPQISVIFWKNKQYSKTGHQLPLRLCVNPYQNFLQLSLPVISP